MTAATGRASWAGRYEDHSAYSLYGTLGKRSIALDLKTPEGKEILWRLLRGADVFIEGFRPGTIQRYGFGYDAVSAQGAADHLLFDLRLRADRAAGGASGDGPGAAGVHRHRRREQRRA